MMHHTHRGCPLSAIEQQRRQRMFPSVFPPLFWPFGPTVVVYASTLFFWQPIPPFLPHFFVVRPINLGGCCYGGLVISPPPVAHLPILFTGGPPKDCPFAPPPPRERHLDPKQFLRCRDTRTPSRFPSTFSFGPRFGRGLSFIFLIRFFRMSAGNPLLSQPIFTLDG